MRFYSYALSTNFLNVSFMSDPILYMQGLFSLLYACIYLRSKYCLTSSHYYQPSGSQSVTTSSVDVNFELNQIWKHSMNNFKYRVDDLHFDLVIDGVLIPRTFSIGILNINIERDGTGVVQVPNKWNFTIHFYLSGLNKCFCT